MPEYTKRIIDYYEQVLDLRTNADVLVWDALFTPSANLAARGYQGGKYVLRDLFSGMALGLVGKTTLTWAPISPACLRRMVATGAVAKRRLVQLVAPDNVSAMTVPGAVYQGLALNDAASGEFVYVLLDGAFPCEVGAVPPTIGNVVVSDGTGKAIAGAAGNSYAATAISAVTAINGVNCQLLTLSGVPAML